MSVNRTFFWLVVLIAVILGGCGPQVTESPADRPVMPTPTFHALLSHEDSDLVANFNSAGKPGPVPTVADFFNPQATWSPPLLPTPNAPNFQEEDPIIDRSEVLSRTVVIYNDEISAGWDFVASRDLDLDAASSQPVHWGDYTLALTPKQDFSTLSLVVTDESETVYPRDQVLGVSFWLNSGDDFLNLDNLAVTVLGSNDYSFYVPGDQSVTNVIDPVFSETRLYYLGLNHPIPPDTWVQVDLWMDDRIYDPDYEYVTGIYFKTGEGYRNTFYIDDINLMLLDNSIAAPGDIQASGTITVGIDLSEDVHFISPLIYGISGLGADAGYLEALRPTLNSWGGNPSTRYNWRLGNAWNAGRDWLYRNGNYGVESGSASTNFITNTLAISAEVRLAVPTLGWVAKDDNNDSCSFPMPDGSCGDAGGASCENPGPIADPELANVESSVNSILSWMTYLFREKASNVRFLAMDNEPELWGITHYDVHPECTSYQEILDKYLEYATAIRKVAPQAELTGPVTCCWNFYWNSAAGYLDKIKHENEDFIPWFLTNVRARDEKSRKRSLDVLDIHYYPEGLYNDDIDPETAARRLRSTRSLWDETYIDESWIAEPVYLIPRMKKIINDYYPGTHLGISEWNWGADTSVNGALAIADVLGIFGRQDLYFASYWTFPPLNSPGFYAFKLYTNYDQLGGRFGDTSIWTTSNDVDRLSNYAALDSNNGDLHLMLINKELDQTLKIRLDLDEFVAGSGAKIFRYGKDDPDRIVSEIVDIPEGLFEIELPPYSISHLVIHAR